MPPAFEAADADISFSYAADFSCCHFRRLSSIAIISPRHATPPIADDFLRHDFAHYAFSLR
jgi:hypothetical protein